MRATSNSSAKAANTTTKIDMTACLPAANNGAAGVATCDFRLGRLVVAYDAIVNAMMAGQMTALVQFGEQRIMYEASATNMKLVLSQIAEMNKVCPSAAASAILGMGGRQGPIRPEYNPPGGDFLDGGGRWT